ncbi:MAG TPA: HAD family phosphatase [Thermoanaerobaculia bacterium]|jgi:HAD superfamily hydrolase (TIGR01509 family)|nr:HAD family phosphatase [Thermoanaerobaculia bacterium]
MRTISRGFLFDLDGVLVRSEELHHEAYRRACAARGFVLPWSFERYCLAAHYGPEHLQEELRRELPDLLAGERGWDLLYGEKSRRYLELLAGEDVPLQPGAAAALQRLAAAAAPHAVVTNSTRQQTALLRRRHAALDAVPLWVTREDYAEAKPAPDAYRAALQLLGAPPTQAVGFEDTPRGLQALAAAGVPAVLVSGIPYPDLGEVAPLLRVPNLAALPAGWLP